MSLLFLKMLCVYLATRNVYIYLFIHNSAVNPVLLLMMIIWNYAMHVSYYGIIIGLIKIIKYDWVYMSLKTIGNISCGRFYLKLNNA